jgi:hypothetical protein
MAITHHVVRSVLLSQNGGAAVTLEPVEWWREVPDRMVYDGEDGLVPDIEVTDPASATDVMRAGGKMTELRFDEDPGYRPGDFVTVTVDRTTTPAEFDSDITP